MFILAAITPGLVMWFRRFDPTTHLAVFAVTRRGAHRFLREEEVDEAAACLTLRGYTPQIVGENTAVITRNLSPTTDVIADRTLPLTAPGTPSIANEYDGSDGWYVTITPADAYWTGFNVERKRIYDEDFSSIGDWTEPTSHLFWGDEFPDQTLLRCRTIGDELHNTGLSDLSNETELRVP